MPDQKQGEVFTIQMINILRDGRPFCTIGPSYFGLSEKNVLEFEATMLPAMTPVLEALVSLGMAKAQQQGKLSASEADAIGALAASLKG
jgi:hypothetical protein